MKNFMVSVVVVTLSFVQTACRQASVSSQNEVIKSWVKPNTAAEPESPESGAELTASSPQEVELAKQVDAVFSANQEALENNEPKKPNDSWKLQRYGFDLAVSLEGLIGVLIGEGEASVKTFWKRRESSAKRDDRNSRGRSDKKSNLKPFSRENLLVHFDGKTDSVELSSRMDAVTEVAARAGVKNASKVRQNLISKAKYFQWVGKNLDCNAVSQSGYQLGEYKQRLGIDVEGEVFSIISAGVLVQFDLTWEIHRDESACPGAESVAESVSGSVRDQPQRDWFGRRRPSLERFLKNAMADIESQSDRIKAIEETEGIKLTEFYLELGVTVEAEFGIAHTAISSVGKLIFARSEGAEDKRSGVGESADGSSDELPIVTSLRDSGSLDIAKGSRNVFRKGIRRALKMSRFFAARARRAHGNNWELYFIEPEFELALHGGIGLVSVEGNAAIAFEFERESREAVDANLKPRQNARDRASSLKHPERLSPMVGRAFQVVKPTELSGGACEQLAESGMSLENFSLTISPHVGFALPWLFEFEVAPLVSFTWVK